MVMLLVSPLPLQFMAVAEETVTAEGPVLIKSVPLGATELHKMGSANVNVIVWGVQGGGETVPIAMAGCGANTKLVLSPAVTCRLQFPIRVLPSEPLLTCTW